MKKHKKFKETWNSKDEVCPQCGQITKVNNGLTKQHVMNLFKKPTLQDWVILIIMILALYGAFEYQNNIQGCQDKLIETYNNPQELCQAYYSNMLYGNKSNINFSNLSNVTIINPLNISGDTLIDDG